MSTAVRIKVKVKSSKVNVKLFAHFQVFVFHLKPQCTVNYPINYRSLENRTLSWLFTLSFNFLFCCTFHVFGRGHERGSNEIALGFLPKPRFRKDMRRQMHKLE